MAFLTVNSFFSAFSKIPTKRTFVCLLFFKLNQSKNEENVFFGGFFFQNKKCIFWGSKIVAFKT